MPYQQTLRPVTVSLRFSQVELYCNGFVGYNNSTSDVVVQTDTIERVWGHTPNYTALRRAGARLPDLAYSYSRIRRDSSVITYTGGPLDGSWPCGGPWDITSRTTSYEKAPGAYVPYFGGDSRLSSAAAISRLLSRARGAEFNAPVFLGEARETLRLLLGTAQRMASAYRNLRRGRLTRAMRDLGLPSPTSRDTRRFNRQYGRDARRAAANKWLELQYGWKPLLNDARNAAEQMAEFATSDASLVGRVTGSASLTSRFEGTQDVEVSPPGSAVRRSVQRESYRAVWLFKPSGLNDLGSLGLLNPLLVAWELLPLSFVVDWMFPVGRYLEALDTRQRFIHVGGSLGYLRTVSTSWSNFIRAGAPGQGDYQSTFTLVTREPFVDVPEIGLESIQFEPNIGVQRFLSGLALASQSFRR